ncbi:short-chain dehydrogenase/reductase SDR [Burkholderia sp. H160]|nr:short-chain dehydrogenase/reductase SDR [Burkholderia sp. H160]
MEANARRSPRHNDFPQRVKRMNDPLMASWPDMPLAVVLGAGGMGTAIARRLAQNHRLILADLNPQRLDAVVDSLKTEGAHVQPVVCDVTQSASVQALAAEVSRLGPLRTLVHVAGLSPSRCTRCFR